MYFGMMFFTLGWLACMFLWAWATTKFKMSPFWEWFVVALFTILLLWLSVIWF